MRKTCVCFCILCAILGLALVAGLLFAPPASAADQPAAKGPISFIKDVAPIFKENCFACHDAKKRKGKLDMTTYDAMRKGGDSDDPVAPGKPDESHLVGLMTTNNEKRRMPPKEVGDPLPKNKIAIIEQWIKEGAKCDVDPKADLLRELRLRWKPPQPPVAYKFPTIVNALAFTPDGKKLVVSGHHELTIWDIDTAKVEKRIHTRAERAYA